MRRCCRSAGQDGTASPCGCRSQKRVLIDRPPKSALLELRVDSTGDRHAGPKCSRPQSPPPRRLGTMMTTIATTPLTQGTQEVEPFAPATIAATLAATALEAVTSLDFTHGRRCSRAFMLAGNDNWPGQFWFHSRNTLSARHRTFDARSEKRPRQAAKLSYPAAAARSRHECLKAAPLVSAGDNQGEFPCSQYHTGSAEQPVCDFPFYCFYHFVPPLRQYVLSCKSSAGTEVPFRAPIQSASLILGNIGNNMGHLSAMVPQKRRRQMGRACDNVRSGRAKV